MTSLLFAIFLQTILRLIFLNLSAGGPTTLDSTEVPARPNFLSADLKKSIKSVLILSMWFGMHMVITGCLYSYYAF